MAGANMVGARLNYEVIELKCRGIDSIKTGYDAIGY